MLLLYVVYCVALHFNSALEKWAQTWPVPCKQMSPEEESALVSYKTLDEDRAKMATYNANAEADKQVPQQNNVDQYETGTVVAWWGGVV